MRILTLLKNFCLRRWSSFDMKITSLISAIIFICIFRSTALALPRVNIPFSSWNFGTVNKGEVISHEFEIYNSGKSELVIGSVMAPCGCVASLLSSETILPGEMVKLAVKLDTAILRKEKVDKNITIYSNDVYKPKVLLNVSGTIKTAPSPKISIKNPFKNLGFFFQKQKKEFYLKITNDGNVPLILKDVFPESRLAYTIDDSFELKEGESREILFLFSPPAKNGSFSTLCTITSNDTERPEEYIKVEGYVANEKALMIYPDENGLLVINGLDMDIIIKSDKNAVEVRSMESFVLDETELNGIVISTEQLE